MARPEDAKPYVLDHVAVAVPAMAPTALVLVGTLGAQPFEGGPGVGFQWSQWVFASGGRLELIEPHGPPDGFLHRFLARHGAGVHHVTFKVPELAHAAERARRFGYDVVGYDDRHPSWKEAFLHPKQAQGIVVQLAESHAELDPGPPTHWSGPPLPANPPAAVRLLRLELVAPDAAAVRRQWGELLGGVGREQDGRLLFGWPDSPLGVAVRIAPGAPGPTALELIADRALPEPVLACLGTPLRSIEAA